MMEHFFYNDNFYSDVEELMDYFDITEENIYELPEDWSITCNETTLQKIFVIKKEFAVNAILNDTDTWEDRFPEDSDDLFKQIEKAIGEAIDIDKLNELLPELYYQNGNKFNITKTDLINYCKP